MEQLATIEELSNALRKSLPDAQLHRIPKHPGRRDLLLAAISTALHRRYPYTEVELNAQLEEQLARINALVDHVTLRRYLVDCGFVRRDAAGTRYYLYYPKLAEVLTQAAAESAQDLLQQALDETRRRPRQDAG